MGIVKGNPLMIVTLFFGAAVLSMGGIYSLVPSLLAEPDGRIIAIVAALCISMGFSLLIVGRTFWVVAQRTHGKKAA